MSNIEPQCRDLNKLCPCIRKKAEEFVRQAELVGVPVTIYETLRGVERQKHYIKIGVSWTMNSYHLPQPPDGLSMAFDSAPTEYLTEPLWKPEGEHWETIAFIARNLGLKCGRDWQTHQDSPHFYVDGCKCDDS